MTKIITVEEHFDTLAARALYAAHTARFQPTPPGVDAGLIDFEQRLAYMDQYGIEMQILSDAGNSPQLLADEFAIPGTQALNDALAEVVAAHPTRFAGLASLPAGAPKAAAQELHRAVGQLGFKGGLITGTVHGEFLDAPKFLPIFEAAAELQVPLYLHPGYISPNTQQSLYDGDAYSPAIAHIIGLAGWGWHMEQGIQMVRLILSGVFDRYPDLQLISGHWGEFVPTFLERLDEFTGNAHPDLKHPFSYYYRKNVYLTASGMFTKPQLDLAMAEMGSAHLLWAEDYPYLKRKTQVADFLANAGLTEAQQAAIGHENAERLFKL